MLFIFTFSLAVLIYIFAGYPAVLFVLSSLFGKENRKKEIYPTVSLIISAYNEENVIKKKIENSLKLDYPKDKLEIIVASEAKDKTNSIVESYADKGVLLYSFEGREGKRATLFRTVPKAKGEIIVFSDANGMYEKDAIKKLVRNFEDKRIGCVSGRLRYVNFGESSIGKGEGAYWEFDFLLKKMASRLFHLGGGVNGSILAIRKSLYNPIDKYRGDDFELACRVEIDGFGVILEPEADSYEEVSEKSSQEFKRKVRLATWNFKSSLLVLKEAVAKRKFMTAFLVFSHRFLRYTTPIWLILLFVSNSFLLHTRLKYLFLLQLALYLSAAFGWLLEEKAKKMSPLLLLPFYFCMVNWAALIGLYRNLRGNTESLWEKVR